MIASMIPRIGRALFGPNYHYALADALGVRKRVLQRWEAGDMPISPLVWGQIRDLLRKRAEEIAELRDELAETTR